MSFRTREEYEEAKRTWYPAPHVAYIQETGDWISFIGSDDLIFEDEALTKIMGNVKLRDVNKLQQLNNRFRKSERVLNSHQLMLWSYQINITRKINQEICVPSRSLFLDFFIKFVSRNQRLMVQTS